MQGYIYIYIYISVINGNSWLEVAILFTGGKELDAEIVTRGNRYTKTFIRDVPQGIDN